MHGAGDVAVRGACCRGPGESVLNQEWDCAIVWGLWGVNARALRVVRRIRGVAQFG